MTPPTPFDIKAANGVINQAMNATLGPINRTDEYPRQLREHIHTLVNVLQEAMARMGDLIWDMSELQQNYFEALGFTDESDFDENHCAMCFKARAVKYHPYVGKCCDACYEACQKMEH